LRYQGATLSPRQVRTITSLRTRSSKATRPQAECFASVETDVMPAKEICISAIMTWFPSLNVIYQLKKLRILWKRARFLFVALCFKMLRVALKSDDHLASPPGPEQTCAARVTKFVY
jgi:hypothetical protein